MILVVGSTGLLGGEICRLLATEDRPLRALVRTTSDPAKVDGLRSLGADLVVGDLKDRGSLDAACAGVEAVVSTASSTLSRQEGDTIESVDRDGQLALVDAAASAGVERFVFVSFTASDIDYPLQQAKRAVEKRLAKSGLAHTVVRATFFMEVWLSPVVGFDAAGSSARIYGTGAAQVSWISFRDVARQVVALLDEAARGVLDVGGPDALSQPEVVRIFEEETRRTFTLDHVPEEALETQRTAATDSLEQSFPALMLSLARGTPVPPASVGELTTVRDFARAQRYP